MDYKEHIECAIAHIEKNLKNDLALSDIAQAAGYSVYHFIRVFKQTTGLTPADYIRKRRLSEIAREMEHARRPISDIAFEYGFNSKENFIRAFKAEHNILPGEYKASGNSLKLYNRLHLSHIPFKVTPEIITLDGFTLTVYPNREGFVPRFWNLYNCKKLSLRLSGGKTVADYGVSSWNPAKQCVEYFIGIRSEDAHGDTAGTQPLEIPGGLYAVFTTPPSSHFDFVNTIHKTWGYINCVWLANSAYRHTGGVSFETYVEASRTYSEKIYIPVTHSPQ